MPASYVIFWKGGIMNKEERSFINGPILPALLRFAFPVLLALFLQTMYGAVDLIIIGQFGTAKDISAVSTGSQIMQVVTFMITSLSMGITISAGQKIGEGKPEEAGSVIGSGICLFTLIALVMTAAMVCFAAPVARLMQAPREAFDFTVYYIRICSAGSIFIVAYNVIGSIFRGIGDSKMPLLTVAIACVCNICGDLFFVAVLRLGVSGAAIATILAQAISVIISLGVIKRKELPFKLSRDKIKMNPLMVKRILVLGVPIALQDFLVSISFLVILAIVNGMGLIASAGLGIAEKLCGFVMLVPSSYMQSMSAFVAQNVGARKLDRAKKALAWGIATSLLAGVFMGYFSFFHGEIMAGFFADAKEIEVIGAAADYLRAYSIDCILTSFLFCFLGYFNGCGKTLFVMIQGIIGAFAVRIPVSYFASKAAGATLFSIGLATPASSMVQILLCLICFVRINGKKGRNISIKE